MRSARRLLVVLALAAAALPVAALADQRIDAAPPNRFVTTDVTIAQGERLTFRNGDVVGHDVTADDPGPDGKPLFSTPIIDRGEEAFVEGSQYLTTGSYRFHCSVHPQMKGTLRVSAAGRPATRPGTAGAPVTPDRTRPRLAVRILTARMRTAARGGLLVRVAADEAAAVRLAAVARPRPGGPLVTVARGAMRLPAAGVRRVRMRLTAAGHRALAGRRRSLAVLVRARADDAAANRARQVTGRTLRR